MTDTLISTIAKNRREEFRIAVRTLKGRRAIDLRVYASNGVEAVATPKGVAIRPDLLGEVIAALQVAQASAQAEGLVPTCTPKDSRIERALAGTMDLGRHA